MSDIDEFGLPTHIAEDDREVTGKEPSHIFELNMLEQSAEIDKVRIVFRSGIEFIFEEVWHSGVVVCMVKTTKGQRPFAVYDPAQSGFNAMKVNAPSEIF